MSPSAEHDLRNGATAKQLGGGEGIEVTLSVSHQGQLLTNAGDCSTHTCMCHHSPPMTPSLQRSFNLWSKYLGITSTDSREGEGTQDKPVFWQGEMKPGPKSKARLDHRRLEVFVEPPNFKVVGENNQLDSIVD